LFLLLVHLVLNLTEADGVLLTGGDVSEADGVSTEVDEDGAVSVS
jgi:hypothetical protein